MPRRRPRPAVTPVLAVLALGMLAGCSAVTGAKPAGAGTQGAAAHAVASTPLTGCGTTRTSAGVPVEKTRWQAVLPLNPAHGLIANFRAAALGRPFDFYSLGVSLFVSGILLFVGCLYFRRVERTFADII